MNPYADKTYAQSIAYLAETFGDKIALTFEGRDFTFRDIKKEADRASAKLAALGVKPGETVAIWTPNRPEFAWLWLGAAQMGAIPVVLNTMLRAAEFEYQIAQSDSRLVFVPGRGALRDFLGELAAICPAIRTGKLPAEPFPRLRKVVALDPPGDGWEGVVEWSSLPDDLPVPPYNEDPKSPALIAYSSGTTSLPKGVVLSHSIWRKAWQCTEYLGAGPNDCLFLVVPLFGVLGFLNGLLIYWSKGARVILRERFDAADFIRTVSAEKCTAAHLVPTMLDRIREHPDYDKARLATLRTGILLSNRKEDKEKAVETTGAGGFISGYGMTESTAMVTGCRWDDPIEARQSHQGWPLKGCAIRVVDPGTGKDLPPGEEGEIYIGGYGNMLGYYNKPEETRNTLTEDGWIRSGDLGYLNPDGSLRFLRRLKDGYKHKGFNVSTPEVESVALKFPGVADAAVVGIPDPQFGESGVIFAIPVEGAALDTDALLAFLKGQLASFKIPKAAFIVDEFPRTAGTDKVRKFKLRDQAIGLLQAGG